MDTSTAAEGDTYQPQPKTEAQTEPESQDPERGGESLPQEELKSGRRMKAGAVNRLRAHLTEEVSTAHADILLLTCCLISGLVDSTIYDAYGTFVSMQTGILPSFLCHGLPLMVPRQYYLLGPRRRDKFPATSESQTLRLG
jgi:hypothetical protein